MLPSMDVVDTAIGKFLLFAGNDLISSQLRATGRWEPINGGLAKILLAQSPLGKAVVVDAGANLGAFTIPLGREVSPEIAFHCFEMQRIVFYQLCGNIVLNQQPNIYAHHIGLGQANGWIDVPVPDYTRESNIGAVSASAEIRRLRNEHATDREKGEFDRVEFRTLDSFDYADLRLLKIDVEGMELDVLLGAKKTLHRSQHPPILLELWNTKKRPQFSEKVAGVLSCLSELGYSHQIFGDSCLAQFPGRPQLKLSLDKEKNALSAQWEPA
jgi:FkbM family methyltransferase